MAVLVDKNPLLKTYTLKGINCSCNTFDHAKLIHFTDDYSNYAGIAIRLLKQLIKDNQTIYSNNKLYELKYFSCFGVSTLTFTFYGKSIPKEVQFRFETSSLEEFISSM